MNKERIHAMVQYYEAIGCWYLAKWLRTLLVVTFISAGALADEYKKIGNKVYSSTGESWTVNDDGSITYPDGSVMTAKEVEKARQNYANYGNTIVGNNGTLCVVEDNHAICKKGVLKKDSDDEQE